jgi:hypothetical protein
MPKIVLAGSIRQHTGGSGTIDVAAATVREAIDALEGTHPALNGWIVDEQGVLRRR